MLPALATAAIAAPTVLLATTPLLGARVQANMTPAGGAVIAGEPVARSDGAAQAVTLHVRFPEKLRGAWAQATNLDSPGRPVVVCASGESEQIELPVEGEGRWYVCAAADGFAPTCEIATPPQGVDLKLQFVAGTRVEGRCLNQDGTPAAAEVALAVASLRSNRPFLLPLARDEESLVYSVSTSVDGVFGIPRLAPGEYLLEITGPGGRLEHSGRFTVPEKKHREGSEEEAATDTVIALGDFVLTAGLDVVVAVTDASGVPVEGADVGAAEGDARDGVAFYQATTNEEGVAILSGFDGYKKVVFSAESAGFQRAEEEYAASPASVSFTLERMASMTGQVTLQSGDPAIGARVALEGEQQVSDVDAQGAFRLEDVAPGAHSIAAWRSGSGSSRIDVDVTAGENLDVGELVLEAADLVEGLVRDVESKDPIAGAVVGPAGWPPFPAATTDSEGRFSLEVADDEPVAVEVSKEGYAPLTTRIPPARGGDGSEPAIIEIGRAGWISVRAFDDTSGGPCIGCRIAVSGAPLLQPLRLVTDGSGEAASADLAPGEYSVFLEAVRSLGSVISVSGGDSVRTATVQPGRVTPVQFGSDRITVRIRLQPDPGPTWRLHCRGSDVDALVTSQGGAYVLRVSPGTSYRLALHNGATTEVRLRTLETPNKSTDVVLNVPQGGLTGRLSTSEGPAVGKEIELSALDGVLSAVTITDGTGAFGLPFIPPGTYMLSTAGTPLRAVSVGAAVVDLDSVETD